MCVFTQPKQALITHYKSRESRRIICIVLFNTGMPDRTARSTGNRYKQRVFTLYTQLKHCNCWIRGKIAHSTLLDVILYQQCLFLQTSIVIRHVSYIRNRESKEFNCIKTMSDSIFLLSINWERNTCFMYHSKVTPQRHHRECRVTIWPFPITHFRLFLRVSVTAYIHCIGLSPSWFRNDPFHENATPV